MIEELYLIVVSSIIIKYIKKLSMTDNIEAMDLLQRNIRLNGYLEFKIEKSEMCDWLTQ